MVATLPAFEPQAYSVPSSSMEPTLLAGDYVVTLEISEPRLGSVVTYRLARDRAAIFAKRVVGLAGDRIQMKGGALHINGRPVARERLADYRKSAPDGTVLHGKTWRETLPNGMSYATIDLVDNGAYDNTPAYTVPPGHVFVLGDNRDNSIDSRVMTTHGFVPLANIVGRVEFIYFSVADNEPLWQWWRLPTSVRWNRLFSWVR